MKKALIIFIALFIVLALATPAFADKPDKGEKVTGQERASVIESTNQSKADKEDPKGAPPDGSPPGLGKKEEVGGVNPHGEPPGLVGKDQPKGAPPGQDKKDPEPDPDPDFSWDGTWAVDDHYDEYGPYELTLTLVQDGDTVIGSYTYDEYPDWGYGTLDGTVDGDCYSGDWEYWMYTSSGGEELFDSGTFELCSTGSDSFEGTLYDEYGYEETTWTGTRSTQEE